MGMLVFLILLGAVVFLILRQRGQLPPAGEREAMAVLQRRYAAGEITREQFEEMRTDLKDRPA